MVTPETQSGEIGIGADALPRDNSDGESPERPLAGLGQNDWISTASFIFGGVAAIGFLVVIFGEYLIPNLAVILAGTIIISLAGIAWGLTSLMLIYRLVTRWLTSDGIANK